MQEMQAYKTREIYTTADV